MRRLRSRCCDALLKFCALTLLRFHGNTSSITAEPSLVSTQNLLASRLLSHYAVLPERMKCNRFVLFYNSSTDTMPFTLADQCHQTVYRAAARQAQCEDGTGIVLTVFRRTRDLDIQHFDITSAVQLQHIVQTRFILVFHIHIDLGNVLQHTVFQPREHLLCQHNKAGGQNAALA